MRYSYIFTLLCITAGLVPYESASQSLKHKSSIDTVRSLSVDHKADRSGSVQLSNSNEKPVSKSVQNSQATSKAKKDIRASKGMAQVNISTDGAYELDHGLANTGGKETILKKRFEDRYPDYSFNFQSSKVTITPSTEATTSVHEEVIINIAKNLNYEDVEFIR